jgi:hypothetical protein
MTDGLVKKKRRNKSIRRKHETATNRGEVECLLQGSYGGREWSPKCKNPARYHILINQTKLKDVLTSSSAGTGSFSTTASPRRAMHPAASKPVMIGAFPRRSSPTTPCAHMGSFWMWPGAGKQRQSTAQQSPNQLDRSRSRIPSARPFIISSSPRGHATHARLARAR